MTESSRVGFIGLGNIGSAMAARLTSWPDGLTVYDVRPEAMTPLVDAGAVAASDLADVARRSDVISIVVLDDSQVRSVVGALVPWAREGTVIAIHSTIEMDTASELASLASTRGIAVIDAPVSGGAIGAAEGNLAAMVGGDRAAYEKAKPVFNAWAGLVVHLGEAGAGTRAKLARNLLTYASFAAAGEAMRLAEAAGIDLRKLAAVVKHSDAINGGASAIMVRNTTKPMSDDDFLRPIFEHAKALGDKDLSLAMALGEQVGVELPMARIAAATLADALGTTTPAVTDRQ